MVLPNIIPGGGGTATVDLIGSQGLGYDVYRVNAVPNPGYKFIRTEVKLHYHSGDLQEYRTTVVLDNGGTFEAGTPDDGYDIKWPIIDAESIDVYFERDGGINVRTKIIPEEAKGVSTGDGVYEKDSTARIDVHQKCNLWIFDHWQFSTGETYSSKSISFTVREDVTCTAYFRHENTGELIFDADGSGDLIMGDGGSLLYNGDLVTA